MILSIMIISLKALFIMIVNTTALSMMEVSVTIVSITVKNMNPLFDKHFDERRNLVFKRSVVMPIVKAQNRQEQLTDISS